MEPSTSGPWKDLPSPTSLPTSLHLFVLSEKLDRLQTWYERESKNRRAGGRLITAFERAARSEWEKHERGEPTFSTLLPHGQKFIETYGPDIPPRSRHR